MEGEVVEAEEEGVGEEEEGGAAGGVEATEVEILVTAAIFRTT